MKSTYVESNIPLVSIITVVLNNKSTIEQTILSVLNQNYKNIEYIIIDGGSTDGTLQIIDKYKDKISILVSEPDKGIYDAMNKGIKIATGELIGIINSDDWYENDAVSIVVECALKFPNKSIFHGDRFNIYPNNRKILRKFNPSKIKMIYYGMTYNHPSLFMRSEIYKSNPYSVSLKVLSDYQLILTLLLRKPDLFCYIPKAYVNYRLEGMSSKLGSKEALKEGYQARRNAGISIFSNLLSYIVRYLRVTFFKL